MLLSIIIPAHNEEKNIVNCLQSIYSQTVDKSLYEVIVVDDASSDKTFDVVDDFAKNIDNLILVKSYKNLNCGPARNAGYKISSGKYIWCIDADDKIGENCLQKIIDKLSSEYVDCLYLNFKQTNCQFHSKHIDSINKLAYTAIGPWCRIYRREFYVNFPDYRPEDVVPFYLMIDKVQTVDCIPELCYYWNTVNPASMTRNFDFCMNNKYTLIDYATKDIMQKNGRDDKWISGILKLITQMYEIRTQIKNPIVKQAWQSKFISEYNRVFVEGKFCH